MKQDYLERIKQPETREYIYHLHNKGGHPYTDITFPFLVDIGSYIYFGDQRYIVEDWILPDDYITDDEEGLDDVMFVVFCSEMNCDATPYQIASSLVRNNKIEKII